ncbi:MAG: STAS domain-containing protein [Planctomycetes bacterium]|nr:STAS domain-containing protein [Planctomycetota bacterium]
MSTPISPGGTEAPLVAPARLSLDAGRELWGAVRARLDAGARCVAVDLRGVERLDTQGAAFLRLAMRAARERGADLRLDGAQGQAARLLDFLRPALEDQPAPSPPQEGLLERLGGAVFERMDELRSARDLGVDALYWSVLAPASGKGLRWGALMDELHEMGVRAIGIVTLLNFLLGIVIALLSAAQLRQVGQTILVADLVVVAFSTELGAFLTGIIVSARTGAAITAELATMTVDEEIDALRSMGLNVARFLIAPKLWALLLVVPALTVLAMAAGNAGGYVVGIALLGESSVAWWNEMVGAATLGDMGQGLLKSAIFAVIIGLVACHNGLRVAGGARGIGLATTRSVVMDIFLIIVADMIFAVFFFFV